MYPWQKEVEKIVSEYNERWLHYVYDPHYNSGKSILSEYLEYKDLAEEIPPVLAHLAAFPVSGEAQSQSCRWRDGRCRTGPTLVTRYHQVCRSKREAPALS